MGTMQEEWIAEQVRQLEDLRSMKGMADTSDQARHYAVTITELEKVIAYFHLYVIVPGGQSKTGGIE